MAWSGLTSHPGTAAALGSDVEQLPRLGRVWRVRPTRPRWAVRSTSRSHFAGGSTRSALIWQQLPVPASDDPFGLTSFGVADVVGRPGEKWRKAEGRLASWVADMDYPDRPGDHRNG